MNPLSLLILAAVVALLSLCYTVYWFVRGWRKFQAARAFWSDTEAGGKLAQHIDDVLGRVEQSAVAHTKHREHLQRFREASEGCTLAMRVCVQNPHPTIEEQAEAHSTAKDLVVVCQQGIEAKYEGIDYERIMARTLHFLNLLKE